MKLFDISTSLMCLLQSMKVNGITLFSMYSYAIFNLHSTVPDALGNVEEIDVHTHL